MALSRAYAPLLSTLLAALGEKITPRELRALMRDVGKRMAATHISHASSIPARVEAASQLLNALGGMTSVHREGKTLSIQGASCPLSVAVSVRPEVCEAVRTMLTEVVGVEVTECCRRGARNQCRFAIPA
jgi:predicted ArsR family transcriptional regulator